MSLQACADIVSKGDPDRFRAAMAAPVDARRVLFPIYAFNVEISRAPWVTKEPMIAEMRLQWWRDALDEIASGGTVRRHEVVDALVPILDPELTALLDELIQARRWDIYSDPFEDEDHFWQYLERTGGNLMWCAAHALGARDCPAVRPIGTAAGLARLLQAVPALIGLGKRPLPADSDEAIRTYAKRGLTALAQAENLQVTPIGARAAVISGWQSKMVLKRALKAPQSVSQGDLSVPPVWDQLQLLRKSWIRIG